MRLETKQETFKKLIFLYLYGLYTWFYKKFEKTPALGMNLPLY